MVVPLTSNLKRVVAAGNVLVEPSDTGLRASSVALVCQVVTVNKSMLQRRAGILSKRLMHKVDHGLRLALGLTL